VAHTRSQEIKWILTVDAQGAQTEIQNFSKEIDRLKTSNTELAAEIKTTNAEIKSQEKELNALARGGQQSSDRYHELSESLAKNRAEVVENTKAINDNKKAIDEQNKKIQDTIKAMNLQDMTMSQLRQRAADLQKQLERTAVSTSPEAYKKLQKELSEVKNRMSVVQNTGKGLTDSFAGMSNPIGSAIRAVQGFGQALKLLLANPVVAIMAAIVAVFMAFKDALFKNEEAMNALNRIMAPFKVILDLVLNVVQKLIIAIIEFVEKVINGATKMLEKLPLVGNWFKKMNDEAREGIELEKEKQALQNKARENLVKNAELERDIAILHDKVAQRDKYNAKERQGFLEEAIRLENEIMQNKIEQEKANLRILETEAARTQNTKEMNDEIARQTALIINLETEFFNKTRRDQRALSSAIMEEEGSGGGGGSYRGGGSSRGSGGGGGGSDAAQKAIDKQTKIEEEALKKQINLLKKARLEGEITEKEYIRKVEQLTLESNGRLLKIKGQGQDKILQLEAAILDAQYKMQVDAENERMEAANASIQADKDRVEELKSEKEKELQMLDAARNERLSILQEEETDQKIYALRAAEIEAQTMQARLDVINQFSETLRQAELENEQVRIEAIEANMKDIIAAEKNALLEQEKVRRLFVKSMADFDRQYNIRTWEQRKDDELRILQRQYDEKLIAEETYQLALVAIEKKYRDEKLKARQEADLTTMKESFNAELENLSFLHDQKMLSEEEYEQAVFRMRMKYAAKYTQQYADYISQAAGIVADLMQAETTNIEARYDAEIAAAAGNKKEVERLEREKAQKKLEVEKKYADVQFAITAAQIIANTAMAIMQAFAQLGPVAGAIAGAIVGVAGVAQLLVANAQRKKVKAMTLAGSDASEAPPSGKVTMRQGLAEGGHNIDYTPGGYTTPGPKYSQAGWLPVHSGEYVVASDEMSRPDVVDKVRYIENIRRSRIIGKRSAYGMAEGGHNEGQTAATIAAEKKTLDMLTKAVQRLADGDIVVNYGITEMEAAQRRKQDVESMFTSNE